MESKQGETLQVESAKAERMGRKLPSASSLFPWDATMLALKPEWKAALAGQVRSENGKCESESESAQTSAEPSSRFVPLSKSFEI
jgi:hypothetical protein